MHYSRKCAQTRWESAEIHLQICSGQICYTYDESSYSQQTLVCLLLVSLVGYIRQINPSQSRAVFQDDVTHIKTQNVFLQPVLQVLKKPAGNEWAENTLRRRHENWNVKIKTWRAIETYQQQITSPLTDIFDFRQLREEPLLILSSKTLCQLLRQHEVVHCDGQTTNVRRLGRHQLKLCLSWGGHSVSASHLQHMN